MACWALQDFLLVVRFTSTTGLIFPPTCAQSLHLSLTTAKHTPLSFILTSLNLSLTSGRDNMLRQVIYTSLPHLSHSRLCFLDWALVLPFVYLGRTGGPDRGMGRCCCHDGKSARLWAQDILHISTKTHFKLPCPQSQRELRQSLWLFPCYCFSDGANLHLPYSGIWVQLGAANPCTYRIHLSQSLHCF